MKRQSFFALLSGFLFAVGLAVAGMTTPGNVIGFLDLFGTWKPALAFVMVGAIGVNALVFALMRKRGRPFCRETFTLPGKQDLDGRLIAGSALFGIGWGLGGFCPGPGLIAPLGGASAGLVFLASMLGGMWIFGAVQRAGAAKREASALGRATS